MTYSEKHEDLLLACLRGKRVLLIYDSLESILEQGKNAVRMCNGYERYTRLFHRIARNRASKPPDNRDENKIARELIILYYSSLYVLNSITIYFSIPKERILTLHNGSLDSQRPTPPLDEIRLSNASSADTTRRAFTAESSQNRSSEQPTRIKVDTSDHGPDRNNLTSPIAHDQPTMMIPDQLIPGQGGMDSSPRLLNPALLTWEFEENSTIERAAGTTSSIHVDSAILTGDQYLAAGNEIKPYYGNTRSQPDIRWTFTEISPEDNAIEKYCQDKKVTPLTEEEKRERENKFHNSYHHTIENYQSQLLNDLENNTTNNNVEGRVVLTVSDIKNEPGKVVYYAIGIDLNEKCLFGISSHRALDVKNNGEDQLHMSDVKYIGWKKMLAWVKETNDPHYASFKKEDIDQFRPKVLRGYDVSNPGTVDCIKKLLESQYPSLLASENYGMSVPFSFPQNSQELRRILLESPVGKEKLCFLKNNYPDLSITEIKGIAQITSPSSYTDGDGTVINRPATLYIPSMDFLLE